MNFNNQFLTFDESVAFLDFLGISFNQLNKTTQISNKSYFNRFAPKLKYDKQSQEFVLYLTNQNLFQDFGQLSFAFDELDFLNAYYAKKYKNEQSKKTYKDFNQLFFEPLFNQSPNQVYTQVLRYVKFVFEFFNVNPTSLNKAMNYSISKPNAKLLLKPNLKKINHFVFDVNNYKGRPKGSKIPFKSISYDGVSKCIDSFMKKDLNKNLGLKTMKQCVEEAAKNYDVAKYFPKFYETALYYVFDDTKPNPKLYSLLLKKFNEIVDKLQKGVL